MGGRGGTGPSPIVPLMLVTIVGLIIFGPSLKSSSSFLSDVQDTSFSFLFIIPPLLVLFVQYMTESVAIPLVFLFVIYMISKTLLGPLVVLLLIIMIGRFLPSEESAADSRRERVGVGNGGEGYGWGAFWLMLVFLVLCSWSYEGETYGWVAVILMLLFFFFFNVNDSAN